MLSEKHRRSDPWDKFPIGPDELYLSEEQDSVPPSSTWSEFDASCADTREAVNRDYCRRPWLFLENEVSWLRMLLAFIDFREAEHKQVVRQRVWEFLEKEKGKELDGLIKVERILSQYFVDGETPVTRAKWVARVEVINSLKSRRSEAYRRKKIASLKNKLGKHLIAKESAMDVAFNNLSNSYKDEEGGLSFVHKLQRLPKPKRKLWSTEENQRLRSGLLIFGRDYESVFHYVNAERFDEAKDRSIGILYSKMARLFCMLRKFSLPLPPTVSVSGKYFTTSGTELLNMDFYVWKELNPEGQVMLPMTDAPFGRRRWTLPNHPIQVNLVG